jgi:23S rRNA pseudouridine1911/1915/1917 synthase
MPRTEWGWLVTHDELSSWIIHSSDDLFVVDKPAHVLCHPSKHGPWSSLIGASREYLGVDCLHMVSRLDRETSGVVVFARNPQMGSFLQRAMQRRESSKTYLAILTGALNEPCTVNRPVGADPTSEFVARQWTVEGGREAQTEFIPIAAQGGYTFCRVHPLTGRRHQIRVHASSIGHPLVGDKLYGPDPSLMFRFIESGYTPELASVLLLDRHALHAHEIEFPTVLPGQCFRAPLPPAMASFCQNRMPGAYSHSIVPGGLFVTS